jgi:hypothetical protein
VRGFLISETGRAVLNLDHYKDIITKQTYETNKLEKSEPKCTKYNETGAPNTMRKMLKEVHIESCKMVDPFSSYTMDQRIRYSRNL